LKKIGLTGGIGSGKTYIAKVFENLGVPVFYADEEAKKILNNKDILFLLSQKFETEVMDLQTGLANRKLIASIVFNRPEKLQILNQIIHPKVAQAFQQWCLSNQQSSYVIKEAAILFESNSYKNLDGVICVYAPMPLRINRVVERDGSNKDEIIKRINAQWSDEQRLAQSNWAINNDENKPILPQVLDIHQKILSLK
jgi:dephospho-CoA kinase